MARFCANCGTEVDESAIFCPTCGQPIDEAAETEMPPKVMMSAAKPKMIRADSVPGNRTWGRLAGV